MLRVIAGLRSLRAHPERGAQLIEYGLLITLIAVVAIVGVILFGEAVAVLFSDSAEQIPGS